MWNHLRYDGTTVEAKSRSGEWTVELLDLNDPQLKEVRKTILKTIDATISEILRARKVLQQLKQVATTINASSGFLEEIEDHRLSIERMETQLGMLTGKIYEEE